MSIRSLSGVHVPHRKNTAAMPAVRIPVPETVTVPLSMHIGAPAKCVVKVNDEVCVGQLIAEAGGFVSAPIHAPVSGKVIKLSEMTGVNGATVQTVVIQSDGLMTPDPSIAPPDIHDYDSFIAAVRASGSVGLGGAGFPTAVKLDVKDVSRVQEVIVNGAECEPYITSDTRTMIDRADDMAEGCRLLEKYLQVKNIIIGVENNKPEAIAAMKKLAAADSCVSVKVLPPLYPQGGEKVLIYHTTGKIVPEGKLPLDVGSIVINCTTLAFLGQYARTGMPLVEKCVTVDGSAVKEPKNLIVPIGTPVGKLFEACGGFTEEPAKVLQGGPMMGMAVYDLNTPVTKSNNAVLAFNKKDAASPKTTQCIRCGNCVNHCPLKLDPAAITRALKAADYEKLAELKVNLCMECGCCSFICPAKQPLVQNNKVAKAGLRAYQKRQQELQQKEAKA